MNWKTISLIQMGVIGTMLASTISALITLPLNCIATGPDGRNLCWQDVQISSNSSFDLTHWKLQIPGPKDIIPIGSYTSKYFYYGDSGEMVFWVDSSETGTTANSSYVRSELREMLDPKDKTKNWTLKGTHILMADLEVKTNTPQVTVLQIHGIGPNGESVKPLLRLAVMDGDLYAWLKLDKNGDHTDKIKLASKVGRFSIEIKVVDYKLTVKINGKVELDKNVKYWTHHNYFKAGNYPQATKGISEAKFYKLEIKHIP